MEIINSAEQFSSPASDNRIITGNSFSFVNSVIKFGGSNNILFIDENVRIKNSTFVFNGSNSIIFLSENKYDYILNITIHNNSAAYIGKNNYINGTLNMVLSEEKHIFIGSNNLFSFGIWLRVADPHLVYSIDSKERLNLSKSIFLGDHVWVGQAAMLLKGTEIHSGSIIGAMALVANKKISSNTSWGGNPAKQISSDIFWSSECVHQWTKKETEKSLKSSNNSYIYENNSSQFIPFSEIDKKLTECLTSQDKLEYLKQIWANTDKNRFSQVDGKSKKISLFNRK